MKKIIFIAMVFFLRVSTGISVLIPMEQTGQVISDLSDEESSSVMISASDAKDLKGTCRSGKSCTSPGCRNWVDHDCDGHCDRGK